MALLKVSFDKNAYDERINKLIGEKESLEMKILELKIKIILLIY